MVWLQLVEFHHRPGVSVKRKSKPPIEVRVEHNVLPLLRIGLAFTARGDPSFHLVRNLSPSAETIDVLLGDQGPLPRPPEQVFIGQLFDRNPICIGLGGCEFFFFLGIRELCFRVFLVRGLILYPKFPLGTHGVVWEGFRGYPARDSKLHKNRRTNK